eukprot:g10653.t1
MAPPVEAPLSPEAVARAVTGLPAALFIGDVSGPLNAEASSLGEKLDPKLEDIKADIDATLELCHSGNEPSAEQWHEDVGAVRLGVQSIKAVAMSLLNGTYVAPRARERLHREASLSSFGGTARGVISRLACMRESSGEVLPAGPGPTAIPRLRSALSPNRGDEGRATVTCLRAAVIGLACSISVKGMMAASPLLLLPRPSQLAVTVATGGRLRSLDPHILRSVETVVVWALSGADSRPAQRRAASWLRSAFWTIPTLPPRRRGKAATPTQQQP